MIFQQGKAYYGQEKYLFSFFSIKNNLPGFTLIELILVTVIVVLIAAVSLPKFVNLKTQAIEKSEDALMAALSTAIKTKYTQNLVDGVAPEDAWPLQGYQAYTSNPFILLDLPPLNKNGGVTLIPDGVTWIYEDWNGSGSTTLAWSFCCPHRDGDYYGRDNSTKGRRYYYNAHPSQVPQGKFWLVDDKGH
jgi:prepilin-type N-terminal cleavage/methylation domain-containing protein